MTRDVEHLSNVAESRNKRFNFFLKKAMCFATTLTSDSNFSAPHICLIGPQDMPENGMHRCLQDRRGATSAHRVQVPPGSAGRLPKGRRQDQEAGKEQSHLLILSHPNFIRRHPHFNDVKKIRQRMRPASSLSVDRHHLWSRVNNAGQDAVPGEEKQE